MLYGQTHRQRHIPLHGHRRQHPARSGVSDSLPAALEKHHAILKEQNQITADSIKRRRQKSVSSVI